jgi:hypothetical protein
VLTSLAVVAVVVATGALAGDRLGSLLRPEGEPLAHRDHEVIDESRRRLPRPSRGAALGQRHP